MLINDDSSPYEALAAPKAALSHYESQRLQREQVTNMRTSFPYGSPGAVPPGTWIDDDTPVYWQTVRAMASGRWRRDG